MSADVPAETASPLRTGLIAALVIALVALALLGARIAGRSLGAPDTLALPAGERVALLPIANATGDRAHDWVEIGLTHMVADTLAELPGIDAAAPARVRQLLRQQGLLDAADDANLHPRRRQALQALGAALVVEAILRRDDALTLRLDVYDLSRADGARTPLASQQLTAPDALALGEQLTRTVARSLDVSALDVGLGRRYSGTPFVDQLYGLALAAELRGDAARAIAGYELCLDLRPQFPQALLGRATLLRQGDASDRARGDDLLKDALRAAQRRADRRLQGSVLAELGQLASIDGRADEAEQLRRQAQDLFETVGDPDGVVRMIHARARSALIDQPPTEARLAWIALLEAQRARGDRAAQIDTLLELARLDLATLPAADDAAAQAEGVRAAVLDAARALLDQAEDLAGQLDDPESAARVAAARGDWAARAGDDAAARDRWQQALAHARSRGADGRTLLLLQRLAELAFAAGDLTAAETYGVEALPLAEARGDGRTIGRLSLQLTEILLRRGYPYQARDHLERALAHDRAVDDPLAYQRLIAWLAYLRGQRQLALDTLEAARGQNDPGWTAEDDAFLAVYRAAIARAASADRLPLPTEDSYVAPSPLPASR
ncbi:MAG: hypothetical protein AAF772_08145 [Acidobacteriota bacterium]